MKKHLKLLTASLVLAHTLVTPQVSHGMENNNNRNTLPKGVKAMILEEAAVSGTNLGTLRLVCKEWQKIIDQKIEQGKGKRYKEMGPVAQICLQEKHGMTGENKAIYERFLKGKLIYRPTEGSDEGMIEFKISDLKNPFEGTFDLWNCDDNARKYLSISTGYRKRKNPDNAEKVEVWISPRSLIDKTGLFQDILKNGSEESAPIVLLWTWGGWKDLTRCDYLSDKSPDDISNNNIFENWKSSGDEAGYRYIPRSRLSIRRFHVHFMSQNKDY